MSHYYRLMRLAERPDAIGPLSDLMEQIWPDHYGASGGSDARADLERRKGQGQVPFGIVVLDDRDQPVGGGAVEPTSFGALDDEGPWVVGLCVDGRHRGIGLASQIVAMLEAEAARLGLTRLHTTVAEAQGLMARRGWCGLRDVADQTKTWKIMVKDLG
ncbi:N-acetyltransferase [Loktanella sp. IMCC34160]|uniref:GNAT family N-acetyltransferase n=1 Tax=Loktanella sp. IMCC34160 TaxID=2510646 RepID=UPI00101E0E09|nr:GNAT family N-acetyltransferase [Loktanella sp. IMCC34160]RYG91198.1 N-acetyltransferase [Loktanella sp. IMCC34160]